MIFHKSLLQLYRKYWLVLCLGVVLAVASTLSGIVLVAVSGWFITAMGLAGIAGATINYFTPGAIIRGCAIIRTGGRYLERLITHDATLKILEGLRIHLYRMIARKSPVLLARTFRAGDALSRIRSDVDLVDKVYLLFVVPFFSALLSVVLVVTVLSIHSGIVAFIVLSIMLFCLFALPYAVYRDAVKYEEKFTILKGRSSADLSSHLDGMRELIMLGARDNVSRIWMEKQSVLDSYRKRSDRFASGAQVVIAFCANMAVLATLIVVLSDVGGSGMSAAIFVMMLMLSWVSFDEIGKIPVASQSIPRVGAAIERVFAFDGDDDSRDVAVSAPLGVFSLSFRNVSYGYGGDSVIHDVSFSLGQGERMVLVGPTGSGKTTILNLALGFCQPDRGEIFLCGRNIREVSEAERLSMFSVVEQRPYLFDRTVRDNLRIARPDASDTEIDNACARAGLKEFIEGLPDGYDTFIGENGAQISGGEVKRLALARALLKDAPCLVLDEVGEGLDRQIEDAILDGLSKALGDKALIIVTHRLDIAEGMGHVLRL